MLPDVGASGRHLKTLGEVVRGHRVLVQLDGNGVQIVEVELSTRLGVAEPDQREGAVATLDQRRREQVGSAVKGRAVAMSQGPMAPRPSEPGTVHVQKSPVATRRSGSSPSDDR